MPALPSVPGVIRLNYAWQIPGLRPFGDRWFIKYTGPAPTGPNMLTMATAVDALIKTNFQPLCATDLNYLSTTLIDLASSSGVFATAANPWSGTRAGILVSPSVCTLIHLAIARRYRGGKPRTYFPFGTQADTSGSNSWSPALIAAVTSAVNNLRAGIIGVTAGTTVLAEDVNVSYYGPPNRTVTSSSGRVHTASTLRAVPLVDDITSLQCEAIYGTQRRRLDRSA